MKNILIIRFSSLGDVVLTTGILKYLKELMPEISISIATSSQFKDIFAGLPFIETVYAIDRKAGIAKLTKFSKMMPRFDAVFDLHSNLRSTILKFLLGNPTYTYNKNSVIRRLFVKFRVCKNPLGKHTVQKYFEPFAKVFDLEYPPVQSIRPYLIKPRIQKLRTKTVVIHPFASKKCKEWPYIYELCEKFTAHGIKTIVVGVGEISLPSNTVNKTGFVSFDALKENIALADLFLTTDSGPMHIATAMGVPLVAIFGTTTKELGFYPTFADTYVIENNSLLCRPCHIHGANSCPQKHFQCMKSLTCDLVFNFCMEKLSSSHH